MAISKKASRRKTSPSREAAGQQAAARTLQRQKAASKAARETQNVRQFAKTGSRAIQAHIQGARATGPSQARFPLRHTRGSKRLTMTTSLGVALEAFILEHEYCGAFCAAVEDDRVWMTCTCGAVINRRQTMTSRWLLVPMATLLLAGCASGFQNTLAQDRTWRAYRVCKAEIGSNIVIHRVDRDGRWYGECYSHCTHETEFNSCMSEQIRAYLAESKLRQRATTGATALSTSQDRHHGTDCQARVEGWKRVGLSIRKSLGKRNLCLAFGPHRKSGERATLCHQGFLSRDLVSRSRPRIYQGSLGR
jgi:hypothetical protein